MRRIHVLNVVGTWLLVPVYFKIGQKNITQPVVGFFKRRTLLKKVLTLGYQLYTFTRKVDNFLFGLRFFEVMCMSDFYGDQEAIRVHQIASRCLENIFLIKSSKSLFRNFRVFSNYFRYFFSIKSNNIVCEDLTTKT